MRTLWDLIDPLLERLVPARPPAPPAPEPAPPPVPAPPARPVRRPPQRDGPADPAGQKPRAPRRRKPPAPRPEAGRPPEVAGAATLLVPDAPAPEIKPRRRARAAGEEAAGASMQARYDAVTRLMLQEHRVRVRKWRSGMSGIAWYVKYRDGTVQRLIEAPRPRGPMSAAVFLHEIGHHAIGFHTYKPRCLEEYHAWRWSLEAMEAHGLNITDAVRLRVHRSLWYAVQKARRRGIKEIPAELAPFLEKPPSRRKKTARRR
jgi:hypothetical protein